MKSKQFIKLILKEELSKISNNNNLSFEEQNLDYAYGQHEMVMYAYFNH